MIGEGSWPETIKSPAPRMSLMPSRKRPLTPPLSHASGKMRSVRRSRCRVSRERTGLTASCGEPRIRSRQRRDGGHVERDAILPEKRVGLAHVDHHSGAVAGAVAEQAAAALRRSAPLTDPPVLFGASAHFDTNRPRPGLS
jgi:hypothetical protein